MAMQTQQSSFARLMGARVNAAHEQHKGAAVDVGIQNLPPDIQDGIAKLQVMEQKVETRDGKGTPKGQVYFTARAVVIYPYEHKNKQTGVYIPLCDIPPKANALSDKKKEGTSFEENYFDYQNLFKLLSNGAIVYNGPPDPTGIAIENFYLAAMQSLVNPQRPGGPVYITFTTRGWKGSKRPGETDDQYNKRAPMVFEDWHGLADPERVKAILGAHNPAAGMNVAQPNGATAHQASQQRPSDSPPDVGPDGLPVLPQRQQANQGGPWGPVGTQVVRDIAVQAAGGVTQQQIHSMSPQLEKEYLHGLGAPDESTEDLVTRLVALAMDDPEGDTVQGRDAQAKLEEMALANGWTQEEVSEANWEEVGEFAQNPPAEEDAPAQRKVVVGSRWKFATRDRHGAKLVGDDKKEFPPVEVEITSVDETNATCTVKFTKDGKDYVAARTKKSVPVKFEWLE